MAAFYYGSCPAEGLLWKCANDGRDLAIHSFDKGKMSNKRLEDIWTMIENSTGYGGELFEDIIHATIDLEVTHITVYANFDVYGESGSIVVPGSVSTVSFRQFIKMLHDGVSVAECTLPDGTGLFFTEELSREQRIKKFLNNAVPYIWEQVQKIKSDWVFDDRMTDNHDPKIIKNCDTNLVNHQSNYKMHSGIEVIDLIEGVIRDLPADEAYAIGNAIRYICSYCIKGRSIQDLENVKWYIDRAIENYKKREEGE